MEEKSLLIIGEAELVLLQKFCEMVCKSSLVPKEYVGKPENAAVAIIHGRELGLTPMQSLQGVMNINGRSTVWGDTALAIVQSHPAFEYIKEWEDESKTAHCQVKRKGWEPVERTFSPQDQSQAQLSGKEIHKSYPRRMRQMRARSYALRDTFADALHGISVHEDLMWEEKEKVEVNITEKSVVEKVPGPITQKQIDMIEMRSKNKIRAAVEKFGIGGWDELDTGHYEEFMEYLDSVENEVATMPDPDLGEVANKNCEAFIKSL